jgi:hypothetical protein
MGVRVTGSIVLRGPKPLMSARLHGILERIAELLEKPQAARFFPNRRDGRVVEGARLESVFRGNSNVGSNPTLSATLKYTRPVHDLFERIGQAAGTDATVLVRGEYGTGQEVVVDAIHHNTHRWVCRVPYSKSSFRRSQKDSCSCRRASAACSTGTSATSALMTGAADSWGRNALAIRESSTTRLALLYSATRA